jgi:hypothetical protein
MEHLTKDLSKKLENYSTLQVHLKERGLDAGSIEHDMLEKLFLMLHQSTHRTTYYERKKKCLIPIFNQDWIEKTVSLISPNVASLSSTSEHDDMVYWIGYHFKAPLRVTMSEWLSCKEMLWSVLPEIDTFVDCVRRASGVPRYRRIIVDRKAETFEEDEEYPMWLLASTDLSVARF